MPANVAAATLTATYNDLNSVRELFAANKGQIAGVILEPVVGNSGFIPPTKEFLQVIYFSQGGVRQFLWQSVPGNHTACVVVKCEGSATRGCVLAAPDHGIRQLL